MNPVDPRWLEILKASGWQTTAMAIASTLIFYFVKYGWIPTDDSPYWIAVPAVGAIVFWCLSFAAIGSTITNATKPAIKMSRWRLLRQQQRSAREYIPFMTAKDKEIIGYLVHHNQKMFQANEDGGYAGPLISKGIIRPSGRPGQVVASNWVPFEIPDHIWAVLESNREQFPYAPPKNPRDEEHPWAIPWMVR